MNLFSPRQSLKGRQNILNIMNVNSGVQNVLNCATVCILLPNKHFMLVEM